MLKFDSEGRIWSFFMLDYSNFEKGIQEVEYKLAGAAKKMGKKTKDELDKTSKHMEKQTRNWWTRFGKVAVGFTIAYRAMNAFERGVKLLAGEMIKTLTVIDEFNKQAISVAAIMMSISKIKFKDPFETFNRILPQTKGLMQEMDIVAARHLVTAEELRATYAALAKRGVFAGKKDIENVATIADTIKLIAERSGQTYQFQQEIYGLMDGQVGRGRQLAYLIKGIHPDFKEYIEGLEEAGFNLDNTHALLTSIGDDLFGMKAASEAIYGLWSTQFATLQTIWQVIQRLGGAGVYRRLTDQLTRFNESLIQNKEYTEKLLDYARIWEGLLENVYQYALFIKSTFDAMLPSLELLGKFDLSKILKLGAIMSRIGRFIADIHRMAFKGVTTFLTSIVSYLIVGFGNAIEKLLTIAVAKLPDTVGKYLYPVRNMIRDWIGKMEKDFEEHGWGIVGTAEKMVTESKRMAEDVKNIWIGNVKEIEDVAGRVLEKAKEADDWIKRMKAGWKAYAKDITTGYEMIEEATETTMKSAEDNLTSFMTNAHDEARTFGNFLKAVFSDLNQIVARYISRLILAQTLGKLITGLSPVLPIGPSPFLPASKTPYSTYGHGLGFATMHEGGFISPLMPRSRRKGLAADEVPIIAQVGETYLPKGVQPSRDTYNISIQALDAPSVVELMHRTPEAIFGPIREAKEMGAQI